MSLSTQSAPMENSPQDNNEQMSPSAKLASMKNSLQENNEQMSLSAKLASMANTLREIQSEFNSNGAKSYSSSTISQTMSPTGTRKFSKRTNITDGTGKETTVETSLNAKGQGKQCTKHNTLKDGEIIDTNQSCERVKPQNPPGQKQRIQAQNLPGQQTNNSLNTNDSFSLPQ